MESIFLVLLFGALIESIQPTTATISENVLDIRRLSTIAPVNPELTTTIHRFRKRHSETEKDRWDCKEGATFCFFTASKAKKWQEAYESCIALGGTLPYWPAGTIEQQNALLHKGNTEWISWSSVFWQNGRLHSFDEHNYSPSRKQFSVPETMIVDITRQRQCFGVSTTHPNWNDAAHSLKSQNISSRLTGFDCNQTLHYFCMTNQDRFDETQRNLKLPLKHSVEVRLKKEVGTSYKTQSIRCLPLFPIGFNITEQRPFKVVWILDDAYFPDVGNDNVTSAVLFVPHNKFTKYACEVRYLGTIHGNRSREVEVSTPWAPKLGLKVTFTNLTSEHLFRNYTQVLQKAINSSEKHGFKLSPCDNIYKMINSQLVIIAYFSAESKNWRQSSSINYKENQTEALLGFINGFGLMESPIKTFEWLSVDRCPGRFYFHDQSDIYTWVGGIGEEVLPIISTGNNCTKLSGEHVTRTCRGSLTTEAEWVEPFSIEQNCSEVRKNFRDQVKCVPSGKHWKKPPGVRCEKEVAPRSWDEAMNVCFGGYTLSAEPPKQYSPLNWMNNTLNYLQSSGVVNVELLWLPGKRRVPGGPFYPYLLGKDTFLLEWDNTTEYDISIDYGEMNASKQCLALSVATKTVVSRSCAEKHPTLCIRSFNNGNSGIELLNPADYNIPQCREHDQFVANEFGVKTCYKTITVPNTNENDPDIQCREKYNSSVFNPDSIALDGAILDAIEKSASVSANLLDISSTTNPYTRSAGTVHTANVKPRKRMCHLPFEPNRNLLSYHLNLTWKGEVGNDFRITMTSEGEESLYIDLERVQQRNWEMVLARLTCFGDGQSLEIRNLNHDNTSKEITGTFNARDTSFYCESLAADSKFLRSNTLLWRHSELTFVMTIWNCSVLIVSSKDAGSTKPGRALGKIDDDCDEYFESDFQESLETITKSEFAHRFGPCGGHDPRPVHCNAVEVRVGNSSERGYTVTNPKYYRVAVDYKNYEKLLIRYHVYYNDTTSNVSAAYHQLSQDWKLVTNELGIRYASLESVRSMTKCVNKTSGFAFGSLTLQETKLNDTVKVSQNGYTMSRKCIGDIYSGAFWGDAQVSKHGKSQSKTAASMLASTESYVAQTDAKPTGDITDQIRHEKRVPKTPSVLAELKNIKLTSKPSADEVQQTAFLFSKASIDADVAEDDVKSIEDIIDQVLLSPTETLIAAQKNSNASTSFLTGLEHMLTNPNLGNITLIASGFRGDAIDVTRSTSLLYGCGGLNGSFNNTVIILNPSAQPPNDKYDVTVTFNVSNLQMSRAKVSTVGFVYHPTLRLADAALAEKIQYADVYHINSSHADHEEVLAANYTAFSGMVQVGIRGGAVYNLSEPVNLYFRPLEPVNMSSPSISIICVFWNPKVNDDNGGWSTYGCWYQGIVKGLVHCRCNHFSAFTALYAYGQETTDTVHDKILDWLTLIGCALSLLGLVGVIGAYVIVPRWRVRRPGFYGHHLLFQQSLSLAALLITFLSGFDKAKTSVNCMFVAALLHYFMLVVFFWMLMEAYYYYCLFVKVRGINTSSFMSKACLFAWLVPCLTVIALLSTEMDIYTYTNGTHCWLTTQGFYYTLLPVVATITVINLFVYVLIIVKVGCRNSKLSSTQQPHKMSPHMAVAIFFLLGLSWTFGLLAIGEARTFFSYLFCIFNSLQGCVMFLLFFHRGRVAHQRIENE